MSDATNSDVKHRFSELYDELFGHDGYGRIEVEMKILRRGQKEIILRCGKEYRFVIDYPEGRKARHHGETSPCREARVTAGGSVVGRKLETNHAGRGVRILTS